MRLRFQWRTKLPEVKLVDLSKDFVASAQRLIELRAGRDLGDIPLTDEYWKALRKHQAAHGGKK